MKNQKHKSTWLILSLCFTLLLGFPFFWMFCGIFKSNPELFKTFPILPSNWRPIGFLELSRYESIPFIRQFFNSILISSLQSFGAVILTFPVGYALNQFGLRLRTVILFFVFLILFLPQQIQALPLLQWFHNLGLYNRAWAVAFPGMVSGIGVIYFFFIFRHLPKPLLDAARVEGASEFRIFWTLLPLYRSALWAFFFISFILSWQEHLIPLVLLTDNIQKTAPLGLAALYGSNARVPYAVLLAGSTLLILPTGLLYFFIHKHFKTALSQLVTR